MQPRQNIAKSTCEIIEEEVRRLFVNKSPDALRNMPSREMLTSKAVENINSYYKLGTGDYIQFAFEEDEKRLRIDEPNIIYNSKVHDQDAFIWTFNFIHDYENFCRKLPFWTLSLSISKNKETVFSIVTNPIIDILIFSQKGSGTVNNQRKVRALSISKEILYCKSNDLDAPKEFSKFKFLSLNSVSIEIIYLSMGIIDFFIMSYGDYDRYQDCLLIAKEAGIIVEKYDDYLILANEKNFSAL